MQCYAVIVMGSESDKNHADKITSHLEQFGVPYQCEVASAHKQPKKVLSVISEHEDQPAIYITIAGRSNALSGFIAANSSKPVIACPPFADKTDMLVNIHSTLQMPSSVPVLTVLDPGNAALAVKRIIDFSSTEQS